MWILMYISYLLMAIAFFLLSITGLMGYLQFEFIGANHIEFALISSIFYMFTESLIMFYFIATGKKIKEYINDNNCEIELYRKVIKMKMKLFPHVTLNMVVIGAVFILGGAVHNGAFSAWAHGYMFLGGLVHFVWCIVIQHQCFKENTELVITLYENVQGSNPIEEAV